MKYKYKVEYYITLCALLLVIIFGCYGFYKIDKTLKEIHQQMENNTIQQFRDTGWMPPEYGFKKDKK